MKKVLVLSLFLSAGNMLSAQSYDWVHEFGSSGQDKCLGIDVNVAGISYVTGIFEGTITMGTYTLTAVGGTDIFIAKCANNGAILYAFSEGGPGNEEAYGISCDASGNFAITGLYTGTPTFGNVTLTTSSGYFISYYNSAGTFQWVREFGTPNGGYTWDIDVDAVGCPVVVGYFTGTETFGTTTLTASGPKEAFALRYDASGNFDWAVSMGGQGDEVAYAVNTDANCNIFVAGRLEGPSNFGPHTTTSNGFNDAFITKIDSSGNFQWVRHGGGSNNDAAQGVDVDANGVVTITGYIGTGTSSFGNINFNSNGMMDCFVARYTNSGTLLWANHYGGTQDDYGSDLSLSISGAIFVGGFYNGTATFGSTTLSAVGARESLIMMIDTSGNVQFALSGGGSSPEYTRTIAAGGGYVYFAGMAEGPGMFGTFSISNSGLNDGILGRIKYNEVGIDEQPESTLMVYPNPVNDVLNIQSSTSESITAVNVFDLSGRLVLTQSGNCQSQIGVDVSGLSSGNYIVSVMTESGTSFQSRFIRI